MILLPEQSVEMLGGLAARLAVPGWTGAQRLRDAAEGWLEQLDRQLHAVPGVIPSAAVYRARNGIALVEADTTSTLLHGDLHEGNVRGAEREPWLCIDPKGWIGTAAFDAWTAALPRPAELTGGGWSPGLQRERIARFARGAGLDDGLAVEIAEARAVSTLLHDHLHPARAPVRAMLERFVVGSRA